MDNEVEQFSSPRSNESVTGRHRRNRVLDWVMRKWTSHLGKSFSPSVDLVESDNELCILADLPGVKLGDLDISVSEGALILKGNRPTERRPDLSYLRRERFFGEFQRPIPLPDRQLDVDAMNVKLEKGILQVTIPKKDSSEVVPQFAFSSGCN